MFQTKLTKLPKELEDNFPREVQLIRKFYFEKILEGKDESRTSTEVCRQDSTANS